MDGKLSAQELAVNKKTTREKIKLNFVYQMREKTCVHYTWQVSNGVGVLMVVRARLYMSYAPYAES